MISDSLTMLRHRSARVLSSLGPLLLVLVLGIALTGCGDDNGGMGLEPPSIVGSIDNQDLKADDNPVEFDLGTVFEGEELTFSASSSDSAVVTASVQGTTLTVDPQNGGPATTVTATAENDAGTEEQSFTVSVDLPDGPGPPSPTQ